MAVLGDAVLLYPESTSLLEQLAFIEYSVLKQYATAAPRFRKLLELAPDHPRRNDIEAALVWLKDHGY